MSNTEILTIGGVVISITATAKKVEYLFKKNKQTNNAILPQDLDFVLINDMLDVAGTGDLSQRIKLSELDTSPQVQELAKRVNTLIEYARI